MYQKNSEYVHFVLSGSDDDGNNKLQTTGFHQAFLKTKNRSGTKLSASLFCMIFEEK